MEGLTTDWSKCFICQKDGKCRNPDVQKRDQTYETLSENLPKFYAKGRIGFYFERILIEGETLKETLQKNKAKYHHDCYLKYSNSKLDLLNSGKKRKLSGDLAESTRKFTRSSLHSSILGEKKCSWCGMEDDDSNLHAAGAYHAQASSTNTQHVIDTTKKWKEIATATCNDRVLNLLAYGDVASNELYYHPKCFKSEQRKFSNIKLDENNLVRSMNESAVKSIALNKICRKWI